MARARRWIWLLVHLFIALAGLTAVIYPPQSVQDTSGHSYATLAWATLMAISAAVCMAGTIRDSWVGEYIGLIPLGSTVLVFAVSALTRSHTSWAGGLFLIAFFSILLARWVEVALQRHDALAASNRNKSGGAL